MNGPKLACVVVVIVMLGGFSYLAWMSRQTAQAFASVRGESPAHAGRVERAIQQAEIEMSARDHSLSQ